MAMLGNLPFSHGFILGIVFHPGNKIDTLGSLLAKQAVIIIGLVVDDDGSRIKLESLGDFNIGDVSFGDIGIRRKITFVIQDQVEFDGPFGPAEVSPVEETET